MSDGSAEGAAQTEEEPLMDSAAMAAQKVAVDGILYPVPKGFKAKAAALIAWMESRGCKGLSRVKIRVGANSGVWLQKDIKINWRREEPILEVAAETWIVTSPDVEDAELELAWRLLQERLQGASSDFEPYVDFLWSLDLDAHPYFWEESQLRWLSGVPAALDRTVELRETVAKRVKELVARAQKPGVAPASSGAPADVVSLEAEALRALCLVESRAMMAETEPPRAALVPILDHMQHDPSGDRSVLCGLFEGREDFGCPIVITTSETLKPGMELRHEFEGVGDTELFARYGIVTQPKTNAYASVVLPVRLNKSLEELDQTADTLMKLDMLAERADIDLRNGAQAMLELPKDYFARGRLMPLARFLRCELKGLPGMSKEDACGALFEFYFAGCDIQGVQPLSKLPLPFEGVESRLEEEARVIAWDWCNKATQGYDKSSARMKKFTDVAIKKLVPKEAKSTVLQVGDIVQAHFKAKGPDGQPAKSRTPKEAKVIAMSGDTISLRFTSNSVRHEVPAAWVSPGAADDESTTDELSEVERAETMKGLKRVFLSLALVSAHEDIVDEIRVRCSNFVRLYNVLQKVEGEKWEGFMEDLSKMWSNDVEMVWQHENNASARYVETYGADGFGTH